MLNKLILICFLIFSVSCYAQTKEDSIKIEKLYQKARNAVLNNPTSARPIIDQGLQFCKKKKAQLNEGEFYNLLGNYFLRQSKVDSAEQMFRASLKLSKTIDNLKLEANSLNNLGLTKRYLNEFDSALYYYNCSKNLEENAGNFRGVAEALMNMSVIYVKQTDYPKSIQTLQNCLFLLDKHSIDSTNQIRPGVAFNLGINFFMIDDFEKSLNYFRKAYTLFLENGEDRNLVYCIDAIAHLLELKGDLTDVPDLLNELDKKANKLDHPQLLIVAKNAWANYEYECGHFEQSKQLALEGISLANEYADRSQLSSLYKNVGKSLYELGNYNEAINYLSKAIKEGEKSKKARIVIEMTKKMAECYHQIGQNDFAYDYLSRSIHMQDSLIPEETRKIMQRLEVEYQTELLKKDNTLKQQQIKSERIAKEREQTKSSRAMWIASLLTLLVIMLISFVIRLNKKKKEIIVKNNSLNEEISQRKYYQERYYESAGRKLSVANKHSKREELDLGDIVLIRKKTGSDLADIITSSGNTYTKPIVMNAILHDELRDSFFGRVNKSEIVNFHYVSKIDDRIVFLKMKQFNKDKEKLEQIIEELHLFKQGEIRDQFISSYTQFNKEKTQNQIG